MDEGNIIEYESALDAAASLSKGTYSGTLIPSEKGPQIDDSEAGPDED